MVKVLFLGRLADAAGQTEASLDLPGESIAVEAVRHLLGRDDASLAAELGRPSVRVAINQELALSGALVRRGDEVAFLPPVSGG